METRRFILALSLSLLVFLVYVRFFAPQPPPQQPQQPMQEPPRETAKPERPSAPVFPEPSPEKLTPRKTGKDITIETDLVKAVINTAGGVITAWELKQYREADKSPAGLDAVYQKMKGKKKKKKKMLGNVQLLPDPAGAYTGDRVYPLTLTPLSRSLSPLSYAVYRASRERIVLDEARKSETLVLTYSGPSGIRVEKRFTFYHDDYKVDVEINTRRLNGYTLALGTDFGIPDKLDTSARGGGAGLVAMINGGTEREDLDDIEGELQHSGTIDWFGHVDKYFTASVLYGKQGIITSRVTSAPKEIGDFMNTELLVKETPETRTYTLYAGPKNYSIMQSHGSGLERMVDFGWFGVLAKPMFWLMKFFYGFAKNYGIAIILLTIVVRALLFYPSLKSAKSMEEMKSIQPEMTALREKYKKDPQRMNQELMKLYKERRVNPLGGCLPMLLQLPFFIALYNVLSVSIELRQAVFIPYWINDLSLYDPFYILPVVMGLSMILTMKITAATADPKQAKMMMFMNIAFIFMFARLPAGLLLYITLSNVLSIAQQLYVKKFIIAPAKK